MQPKARPWFWPKTFLTLSVDEVPVRHGSSKWPTWRTTVMAKAVIFCKSCHYSLYRTRSHCHDHLIVWLHGNMCKHFGILSQSLRECLQKCTCTCTSYLTLRINLEIMPASLSPPPKLLSPINFQSSVSRLHRVQAIKHVNGFWHS